MLALKHLEEPLITTYLLYKDAFKGTVLHLNNAAGGVAPDMTVRGPHYKCRRTKERQFILRHIFGASYYFDQTGRILCVFITPLSIHVECAILGP